MMILVAMLLAVGVLMSLGVGGRMAVCRGKLLEKVMHPVRRGGREKKPKRGGDAQVEAASSF